MDLEKIDICIVKSMLCDKKYIIEFMQSGSDKLLHPDIWKFTKLIIEYYKVYKETPTKNILIEKADKNNNLIAYINKYLSKIENTEYDLKEFGFDLNKLKKRYQKTLLDDLKLSLDNINNDDDKKIQILKSSFNSIKEINEEQVYGKSTLKDGILDFVERFKYRKDNPEASKGTYSGFTSLDFITSGFKTPEYILCCGSSGAGKSTLLMSLAANMFMGNNSIDNDKFFSDGNSVIYYSLEVPYEECFDKLISYISKIPLRTLKNTDLSTDEQSRLNKTLKFIKNYPYEFLIVDIPKGATASRMEAIYKDFNDRQTETSKKVKITIIDYIGLLSSDEDESDQDWLKQTAISEQLYKFCRVNDLILITGVQLNETAPSKSGGENQVGVFRLARSKAIINPSTLCLMLEKRPDEENHPNMMLHIIKNRRGPLGKFSIRKSFETCAFLNDTGVVDETGNTDDISMSIEKFDAEEDE